MAKTRNKSQVTEGTMSRMKRVRNLIDKVVLAHASTSSIWIYYGLLVLVVVIQVAGTDA